MAKMFATEAAQRGDRRRGAAVRRARRRRKGAEVERLYREIRALRIYEGATEVQKIVIARELLKRRRRMSASLAADDRRCATAELKSMIVRASSTRSRATTCRRATQWPDFIFTLPELQYPERMNCAVELLDRWVETGHGDAPCLVSPDGKRCTYARAAGAGQPHRERAASTSSARARQSRAAARRQTAR